MAGAIDIHTHAFPDHVAVNAIPTLEKEGGIKAYLTGTVAALLASMDRAGVERSALCSIATRPEHFEPILEWSKAIRSERIEPFPSLHPEDPHPISASRWRTSFPASSSASSAEFVGSSLKISPRT